MGGYMVMVKGDRVRDDGLAIEMGATGPGQAWWEIPLPPCPDCGGDLVWYEAGYVPGTRRCMGRPLPGGRYAADGGCGSLFSVQAAPGRVWLRRERIY